MSVTVSLEIELQRDALHAVVADLVEEGKAPTPDGGQAAVPPLPAQIDDARLEASGACFRSSNRSTSRLPMRLGAFELLAEVDRTVGAGPDDDRLAAVRSWAARVGSAGVLGDVADALDRAGRWASIAHTLLAPARTRLGLRGAACPQCGAAQVLVDSDSGEETIEPALGVDTRSGTATCWAADCGAYWPADLLDHLATMLDHQSAEVLAVG